MQDGFVIEVERPGSELDRRSVIVYSVLTRPLERVFRWVKRARLVRAPVRSQPRVKAPFAGVFHTAALIPKTPTRAAPEEREAVDFRRRLRQRQE